MHTYGGDPSLPPRLGSCSQQEHLERAGPGRAGFGSCHGWITPRQGRVEDFLLHLSSIFPHTALVPLPKDVLEQPGCSEWLRWERRGLTRERLCRRQNKDCSGIWNAARWWRRLQGLRRSWHKVPEPRVGRTSPRDRTGSVRTGKSLIQNADKSRELFLSEKTSH